MDSNAKLQSSFKKQQDKWIEGQVKKFCECAVPHHVNLLREHKVNLHKYYKDGDWKNVHREQINASRVVKQLHCLIKEMECLRTQVVDSDLPKLDKMLIGARESALVALREYVNTDLKIQSVVDPEHEKQDVLSTELEQKLLDVEVLKVDLDKNLMHASMMEKLQADVEDVHTLFQDCAKLVKQQGESVNSVEQNVETAAENVAEGEKHLLKAVRVKSGTYPIMGALIGSCVGGPVGFLAGLKLGGLAAIGCSLIGFTGGRILKEQELNNTPGRDVLIQNGFSATKIH